MEYTLRTPALSGEIAILYSVAEAMADRRANASGAGFHRSTFDGAILQYTNSLIVAAESGRLQVCNKFGDQGTPAGILEEAISKGQFVSAPGNERLTLALQVCVRLHHLNLWAQERGDIFRVELVGWADERGHVWPSEPRKAKESSQTDVCGGSQTVAAADDAMVPVPAMEVSTSVGVEPALTNWKMRIQAEATSRFKRLRASGANPTVHSMVDDMARWCREHDVKTDGDIYPKSGYLRTHVLGGNHWTPPR